MITKPVELIIEKYGPYAFGCVMIVTLWFTILKPELDRQALDFSKQQTLIEQMAAVANSMEKTALILERTASMIVREENRRVLQQ